MNITFNPDVTADFPGFPFVMTVAKGSDLYGNPRVEPVMREEIPRFYADFWSTPQASNHGHTIHEYWMEQSRGRVGVAVTAFGPYRMPKKQFQYGNLRVEDLPPGDDTRGNLSQEVDALWAADAGKDTKIDFRRPDGTPVMRTVADYRQLNDALFHAGLNSRSQFEWTDVPNRLHFYVVDRHRDPRGVLSYTLAVRSLDGAGAHQRGVVLTGPENARITGPTVTASFTLTNTGRAAPARADAQLPAATTANDGDVYRVSVTVEGAGWTAAVQNALAAVKFGASQAVPVFIAHDPGAPNADASARVTLTATSEGDPTKMATATYTLRR